MSDKLKAALAYLGDKWVLHPKSTYKPTWGDPHRKFYPAKPFLSMERL